MASSPSAGATHRSCPPGGEHQAYRPRAAEQGVLYTIVREHLETFLRAAAERAEGAGLPHFVEQEFRNFLTCGILAHGFARLRCDTCAEERLTER
jgi:hypothetical protein